MPNTSKLKGERRVKWFGHFKRMTNNAKQINYCLLRLHLADGSKELKNEKIRNLKL